MGVAVHANLTQPHQRHYAAAIADGFARHGVDACVTQDIRLDADLHVCIGPWHALERWRYGRTLYLDRAYWGDPECVSVHWLKGGEKYRKRGNPYRAHPALMPLKLGQRRIYLCDYNCGPVGDYDTVRYHPAQGVENRPLMADLQRHDIAIGKRTTALVTAHIAGLRVQTDDPHSPVYGITDRRQWVIDLAWHNWSYTEIADGRMWEWMNANAGE